MCFPIDLMGVSFLVPVLGGALYLGCYRPRPLHHPTCLLFLFFFFLRKIRGRSSTEVPLCLAGPGLRLVTKGLGSA